MNGHPIFDVENEIVRLGNVRPPVDVRPFQSRINAVAGLTPTGKPRLRITWGQDFDSASMWICEKRRLKYPFWRVEEAGEIHDIGIPRFYIEELHDLAELSRHNRWQQARFHTDEESGEVLDVLGPMPTDGFYSCLFMIAHHDDSCCGGEGHVRYEPCLGGYREPNESDITRIQRAIWNRNNAAQQENQPSDELIAKRQSDYVEARDQQRRQTFRQNISDWVRTHAIGWDTLDPGEKSWGKYHFTAAHNRGGLIKKESDGTGS